MDRRKNIQHQCKGLIGLLCSVLVAGCGTGDDPLQVNPVSARVVSGNISKGPLGGATIRAYEIDSRGIAHGPVLAQTTTDAAGNWSLSLPVEMDNLVIESTGGVYVDEADPQPDPALRRTVQLGTDDVFATLLPTGATSVALNIYTDALLRKSRHETRGANFFSVYALNRSFLDAAFGFDIVTTQPADPIQPATTATLDSRLYAMSLGGVANAVNALAIENQQTAGNYQIITALMEDLTDCIIDGHGVAGPVQGMLTLSLNLNSEILRFRNNNFNAYQGTPLLQIDHSECARSGLLPDTIAPEFIGFPGDFVVSTSNDQGLSSAAPGIQNALQAIQAIDDRDGPLNIVDNLPDILPIGDTRVTFSATDSAGNNTSESLVITLVFRSGSQLFMPGGPDYGQLPTLPDANEIPLPPIDRPAPNDAGEQPGMTAGIDSDLDGLSDQVEQALGTDPHDTDTDRDGITDAMEEAFASDPLSASTVVYIPATSTTVSYDFSFADTTADRPAFIVYEPGLHNARVRLTPPCNNVVVIGNMSATQDPAMQARIAGDSALTTIDCKNLRLHRIDHTEK